GEGDPRRLGSAFGAVSEVVPGCSVSSKEGSALISSRSLKSAAFIEEQASRAALLLVVPSERPTPGLGDVRFNGGKEECTVGAEYARRGARMHGTQRPGRMDG
ncbi:MAG: hypothetical protein M3N56_15640, partial [Actinomycetota bacterium]|nr:hypothetical protein [Actinomycetota bacterium]